MREAFSKFKPEKENPAEPVPVKWYDEQLIYEMCGDDITKRKLILSTVSFIEAEKWFLHRRYSGYVTEQGFKAK